MQKEFSGIYYFDKSGALMVRLSPLHISMWVGCPVFDGRLQCRGLGCLAGHVLVSGGETTFDCVLLDRVSVLLETDRGVIFGDIE